MTEPTIKQEPEEQDLFDRVLDKVNADSIRAALVRAKEDKPGDFGASGTKAELIAHLRRAVALGSMTREQVFSLLQEAEENGGQTILYYSPKSEEVRALCSRPEEVARLLFGEEWRETSGFPKLPRLKSGYEVVDFRTPYGGKANDWLIKVYTFQETKVQVRTLEGEEGVQFALKLREGEYAVIYERKITESVCVARWNSDEDRPLLELRIELSGRLARFKMDLNAIWTRLSPAIRQDDFEPWELRDSLRNMLRECQSQTELYQIGLVNLKDSGEGNVRYTPYTENEPIDTNPIRLKTIHQLLDDGGQCDRLVMNWMAAASEGALEENLRTYAGSRGTNELVIRAQTTGRAVDYVTDQLRRFAVDSGAEEPPRPTPRAQPTIDFAALESGYPEYSNVWPVLRKWFSDNWSKQYVELSVLLRTVSKADHLDAILAIQTMVENGLLEMAYRVRAPGGYLLEKDFGGPDEIPDELPDRDHAGSIKTAEADVVSGYRWGPADAA